MVNSSSDKDLPQLGLHPISDVIAALTNVEKVNLLIGTGSDFPGLSDKLQPPVVGATDKGKVPGAAGNTFSIARLGIPAMVLADGPAGVRISPKRDGKQQDFYCTAFPIATMLASSWDLSLLEQVGKAMGQEALEYGVDILLSPAVNIHRNPLGGRNFEYFSEDPLVSGKMAAAIIRGIQGKGIGTSIKHFVGNDHEWNRHVIDVKIDERSLREIYLKSFEIAIKESKPWTVMSSYNKLNGVYTSESSELLTNILRNQWGFNGIVMTDWYGGRDPVAQLQAGNDLLMPGSLFQQQVLLSAIERGQLDSSTINRDIENILTTVIQSPVFRGYRNSNKPNLKQSANVARKAAEEGIVLLQNKDDSLPLSKNSDIALFGNCSYQMITGGTGSGNVNRAYTISLPQGMISEGFHNNKALEQRYREHISIEKAKQKPPEAVYLPKLSLTELSFSRDELIAYASASEYAVITIGRHSGEFVDRKEENDFYLSSAEHKLIKQLAEVFHSQGKKVVVILNICGVIETVSWRDLVDAIIVSWQPGQEAGYAVARILCGKVNPSGKLASSFAIQLDDHPSHSNFPGVALIPVDKEDSSVLKGDKAATVEYNDNIWVGYRSFVTRKIQTAYPFGFGLSYTGFSYENIKLSDSNFEELLTVQIAVKNIGKLAGREVLQLYLSAPDKEQNKPDYELRGFVKTALLQPGKTQSVQIKLNREDLVSFDSSMGKWFAQEGAYTILIGASSTDIRARAEFQLGKSYAIDP